MPHPIGRRTASSVEPQRTSAVSGPQKGRDVLWRGGAIHIHVGGGSNVTPDLHAHFAIQISISMQGPIWLRERRRAQKRQSGGWVLGSDQPHWMHGQGMGITIVLDPLSSLGRRIAARIGNLGPLALASPECSAIRGEFKSCMARGWSPNDVRATVERVIDLIAPGAATFRCLDPRVQSVVDDLNCDSSENVRLQSLAARVGLSESRLAHLFRRDVGIPMRQYRLCLRAQEAILLIAAGRSLTDSAHTAGFADAAHFCRTCRRMFGTAPSDLPPFSLQKPQIVIKPDTN